MYYLIVIISVLMFSGCFALNDIYRKLRTSSFVSSMESLFVGSVAGLIILFAISGFDFQSTPFTIFIALLSAICGICFVFCSFRALDYVNLSLYSLFSMLGGMALPFFQGIIFYGEKITFGKIICVIFICFALLLTVSRDRRKSGTIYYISIFVLNGMVGVFSKIFTSASFEKTNAEWYSIWIAIFTAAISGMFWLILYRKTNAPRYTFKALVVGALNGGMNRVANFLLIIALVHIDVSVQYPMITGGVIIASTFIGFSAENKPTKKEILSVLMAFVGMLALFIIKI